MRNSGSDRSKTRQRTVVFVHVPKAAGTTLRRLMDRQYPEDAVHRCDMQLHPSEFDSLREMSRRRAEKIRCLIGHLPYGIHRYLPQSVDYVTILRNPVNRFLSKFGYLRNNKWVVDELGLGKRQVASLEAFIEAQVERNAMNVQTRQIAGQVDFENPMPPFSKPVNSRTLAKAMNHLENKFVVVGLQERFNESLLMMKETFGWGDVSYQRRNVTPRRVRQDKASARIRALIEKHNELDMELFEFAEKLFAERVDAFGPQFAQDLRTLERQNKRLAARKKLGAQVKKVKRRISRRLGFPNQSHQR